ncbi:hypothetical protein GG344DRAFT_58365 [Lentinula edodes]|nr:hypothetical protein GG344DRAFT_58365 [Lentinula edodes]
MPNIGSAPSENLGLTFGALLCGSFIVVLLFGIFIVQVRLYFKEYSKDRYLLKVLVCTPGGLSRATYWFVCELAHTVCVASAVYIVLVTFYGQPQKLSKLPLSMDLTVAFGAPVTAAVQAFYILRIHKLMQILYIPIFLWILCFLRFMASYAIVGLSIQAVSVASYEAQWGWFFTVQFAVGAFIDVAIAGFLVFNLWRERREAMKQTLKLLDRLIRWTIR